MHKEKERKWLVYPHNCGALKWKWLK